MNTCTCTNIFLIGLIHHCTLVPEYKEIFDEVRDVDKANCYPTCCQCIHCMLIVDYIYLCL